MCNSIRRASDVRYSRCRNRARVGLSVGISVTVRVPSKVCVVIVVTKNVVLYIFSLKKPSIIRILSNMDNGH